MCHYVTLRVCIFLPFVRTMSSNTFPAAYARHKNKKKELLKKRKSQKHILFIILKWF